VYALTLVYVWTFVKSLGQPAFADPSLDTQKRDSCSLYFQPVEQEQVLIRLAYPFREGWLMAELTVY
jgi:hypothetical protein